MLPLIGIILRKDLSDGYNNIGIVNTDIINSVIKSKGIPLGIDNNYIDKYINICNGFIFQGGSVDDEKNISILKQLRKKNIPVLGICQGMQEMCLSNNGKLKEVKNHKNNSLHKIKIIKESLLYKIINEEEIYVNTRHIYGIKKTNFIISSNSDDFVIESIEDNKCTFFLGLQWHPENLYDIDICSRKIFDYFVNVCKNNQIS